MFKIYSHLISLTPLPILSNKSPQFVCPRTIIKIKLNCSHRLTTLSPIMFFINPYYQPPILTAQQTAKRALQIQSLLMMPKQSRSGAIKRQLYEYFIKHPKLIQIQSTKSLRARIMCVGEIELITEQHYVEVTFSEKSFTNKGEKHPTKINNFYIILTKFEHDSTLAVIKTQTRDTIMMHNEEPIKKMMLELKKFSFLKQFEYHELLYLSHFVQKHKPVPYKNYVFQENDTADFVYFIEQGEFQVFKNSPQLTLTKEKSLKKFKKPRESSPLNKFLQNEESPYKMKKVKVNKQELSKIQGGSGQCFGEIQLFLQTQNRSFSLRCNSLTSKMFKIHFKHFQEIFAFKIIRFGKLKRQYKEKYQGDLMRLKLHKKIKDRMGSPQPKLTEEQEQSNALNQKVSSIILEMDNNFNTVDSNGIQGAFTLPNNSLTIPVSELNAKRNIYRDKKLYSENAKKMSVKEGNRYGSQLRSQTNTSVGDYPRTQQSRGTSLDRPFFPLINHNKFSKSNNETDSKSAFQGALASRRNNKVKGLIDISVVISQKQQLQNSMTGSVNPQFSFYKLDEKNMKRLNFQRSQLLKAEPQPKMPTHSKHYLKQFVRNTLKKSKYYQQLYQGPKNRSIQLQKLRNAKTQQIINTTSFSIDQQGQEMLSQRYRQIQGPQYILSKEIRESLVSNEFDQFFRQI